MKSSPETNTIPSPFSALYTLSIPGSSSVIKHFSNFPPADGRAILRLSLNISSSVLISTSPPFNMTKELSASFIALLYAEVVFVAPDTVSIKSAFSISAPSKSFPYSFSAPSVSELARHTAPVIFPSFPTPHIIISPDEYPDVVILNTYPPLFSL